MSYDQSSKMSDEMSPPKTRGNAIPGLDYGLDLLEETPNKAPEPASQQNSHPSQQNSHMASRPQPRPQSPQLSESMQSQSHSQDNSQGGYRPAPKMDYRRPGNDMQNQYHSNSRRSSESNAEMEEEYEDGSQSGAGLLNGDYLPEQAQQTAPVLSYEERRERKINALAALVRLEEAGYVPAGDKGFSFASDLAEMEETVERLKMQRDLDAGIKFQRKMLIGFANTTEYFCSTQYNIFDLELEGWSESIFENITDYDDVFEELYFKYRESISMSPEIKLVGMVAGSAMMFHMSRQLFGKTSSKVPGFEEVMARDPELKRKYTEAATGIARERGMPMPRQGDNPMGVINNILGGLTKGQTPAPAVRQPAPPVNAGNWKPSRNRVPMNDPDDIDGLLSSMKPGKKGSKRPDPEEIDLSEIENLSDLG